MFLAHQINVSACTTGGIRSLNGKFNVYHRWYIWHGTY